MGRGDEMRLKDGQELTIREVLETDALEILDYMAKITTESKNLLREPKEFNMTLEQEERFIQLTQKSVNAMMLCGLVDDQIVSVVHFGGRDLLRIKHRASIGMSVLKSYNGIGVGSYMMEAIIRNAKKVGIKKLDLDVRCDNTNAIGLYKKYGFKQEGIISMGMYVDNKYVDLLVMGKILED